jgi:hypothetical protein
MQLTAGPVGFYSGGALVTGIEDRCDIEHDGTPLLRIYLHARWQGIYILLGEEAADAMRQAWAATHTTHLFVRFDPDDVPRFQTPEGAKRCEG